MWNDIINDRKSMKILTVDIGTGTQDIFLYESRFDIENCFKLVMPSPTMMIHSKIKSATQRGEGILLHGITMGGGPSHWAAEQHIKAGLPVFVTPDAAKSFNDDLEEISRNGFTIISDDEMSKIPNSIVRIQLTDFDFNRICLAFKPFDISLSDLKAVAVGVFDHGNSPPGFSDRQFRFDYIKNRIKETNNLSGFAYLKQDIPVIMTRMQAVADCTNNIQAPTIVMDTAPAAVLGATLDSVVQKREDVIIVNIGNLHTLAFRLDKESIAGVFEHHTGLLDCKKLDGYLTDLSNGVLKHETVFNDHGHGAIQYSSRKYNPLGGNFGIAVTGPRRKLLSSSIHRPYFPAPFGDMMITGCFGLLYAVADILPETSELIFTSFNQSENNQAAPWEI